MSKIKLLKKLKDIHREYAKSNNARKIRLFNASRFVIDELADVVSQDEQSRRVAVAWGATLLCYGDEFTLFEYGLTFDRLIKVFDS